MNRNELRHAARRHEKGDWAKAVVAHCHPGHVDGQFCASIVGVFQHDAAHKHLLIDGGAYVQMESGPRIAAIRNDIVKAFLKLDRAEWLLMVDSDMRFGADTLYRLLAAAHPLDRPVIGGLCFAGRVGTHCYPTIYADDPDVGIHPITDYPDDALVQVGGTGAACLLIHRSVLERMALAYPDGFGTMPGADGEARRNPHPWFAEGLANGRQFGEDIVFCQRVRALGLPVFVHTGIKVGHMKRMELNEATWRAYEDGRLPDLEGVRG